MRQIPLNVFHACKHADAPKFALVDDADYDLVSQHNWYASKYRHTYYAVTNIYNYDTKRSKPLYMHRLILPDTKQVDHKNSNGVDNQRDNLRAATYSTNGMNQRRQTRSRFKGVYFDSQRQKYMAHIKINQRLKNLGRFVLEEEAARTYDKAAKKLFGEFARLNFPEDQD